MQYLHYLLFENEALSLMGFFEVAQIIMQFAALKGGDIAGVGRLYNTITAILHVSCA